MFSIRATARAIVLRIAAKYWRRFLQWWQKSDSPFYGLLIKPNDVFIMVVYLENSSQNKIVGNRKKCEKFLKAHHNAPGYSGWMLRQIPKGEKC